MNAPDTDPAQQNRRSALLRSISDAVAALAAETDEARAGEALARYFQTMSQFHSYSLHNQILIWIQRPEATLVAGYQTWRRKFNRQVRRGEKGIAILAPRAYSPLSRDAPADRQADMAPEENPTEMDPGGTGRGRPRVGFVVVHVFDIAQTDGDPLPEQPDWRERSRDMVLEAALLDYAGRKGIQVVYLEDLEGAEGRSSGGKIELLPQAGTHTLIHELAHELYEHCQPAVWQTTTRQQREIEADTAAHVVSLHFGLPSASANYLALWQAGRQDILACMERVREVALEIIEAVSPAPCSAAGTLPETD